MGSNPLYSKGFFHLESPSSADSVTVSVQSRVQLNAGTSVRTLKIPNTGSHAIVWTHEILHTLIGMGSAAFAAVVPYPGKVT